MVVRLSSVDLVGKEKESDLLKGGATMNDSEYSKTELNGMIDSFSKMVLRYNARNIWKREGREREKAKKYTYIDNEALELLLTEDRYEGLESKISLHDITVFIENELLYNALILLPERRLEIILLSYFWEMSDHEIGDKLNMKKSTVQYNRTIALKIMRILMEEMFCNGR